MLMLEENQISDKTWIYLHIELSVKCRNIRDLGNCDAKPYMISTTRRYKVPLLAHIGGNLSPSGRYNERFHIVWYLSWDLENGRQFIKQK